MNGNSVSNWSPFGILASRFDSPSPLFALLFRKIYKLNEILAKKTKKGGGGARGGVGLWFWKWRLDGYHYASLSPNSYPPIIPIWWLVAPSYDALGPSVGYLDHPIWCCSERNWILCCWFVLFRGSTLVIYFKLSVPLFWLHCYLITSPFELFSRPILNILAFAFWHERTLFLVH